MPDPNAPDRSPSVVVQAAELITHLHEVTQALAAVRQQDEVFDIILNDALHALGGVAGVVLLVEGDHLRVAARRGDADVASVWQDGPLSDLRPGTDVLRSNTPRFFSEVGDLVAAYPDLEAHTGGLAAVATAVLPMIRGSKPLGVIVLDFKEPHDFTPEEERFLITLAGQCALALDRAKLSGNLAQQVHDRTAELEAFVRFTELADSETDALALATRAEEVLSVLFPECTNGYYALEDGLWKLQVYSSDLEADPDLLASLKAGLPLSTPLFAEPVRTGQPAFVDAWDPERDQIARTEAYQSIATYPLRIGGSVQAMFALGFKHTPRWSAHHQAVFRSVGRSLNLALERTEIARQLMAQNEMLKALNKELEAFTYAVSHDLRTPVRHITSFANLLRRSLGSPLGEKTEHYLKIVEGAGVTLTQMIDGMLDLSRTSRQPLSIAAVDLGRLVEAVRKEEMAAHPARQITWQVRALPQVHGGRGVAAAGDAGAAEQRGEVHPHPGRRR